MWKELLEDCHREEGSDGSDKFKYFCEKAARDLKGRVLVKQTWLNTFVRGS